eukprot:TRINITY_DN41972_c0_g1_i1.p1 TRINITY_DN41972_c0_g1~~TRINITY_DN41972_c0_g1_i1.p1  ORF type:complete len:194 (-),score=39.81 TRINITY_DN41972_c0_g1_i1:10-591(-)
MHSLLGEMSKVMGMTVRAAALGDLADELPSSKGLEQTAEVSEAAYVTDALAVETLESNEPGMFDRFLCDHYPRAVSKLRHWTGSREVAEDLAQESAVRLLRYQSLQTPIEWKRIFHRIVVNTFNDWGRQQRSLADRGSLPFDLEAHEQIPDPQADLDRLHGSREQLSLVIGAIEIGRAVQQECRDRSRMPSSA